MENRRQFIKKSSALSMLYLGSKSTPPTDRCLEDSTKEMEKAISENDANLDLSPAEWIWLPAQRTLPNTVVQIRKNLELQDDVIKVQGWILGDSRYKLYINGYRIQWGPAPADPRWSEADPVNDFTRFVKGQNTIAAEVLYYGFGDGTWPIGKPGFIFKLEISFKNGQSMLVKSDDTWSMRPCYAWQPGQYKRWYLRSLQEIFDANKYEEEWHKYGFDTSTWLRAEIIPGASSSKPVISSWSKDYLYDSGGIIPYARLRKRQIGLMQENTVFVERLSEQGYLKWQQSIESYFDFALQDSLSYQYINAKCTAQLPDNKISVIPHGDYSMFITFEFKEQAVGFPFFTIEASAGTIVELLVHEAHEVGSTSILLNTHFNSWSRFICKEGVNHFETFDYESLRWLQLHIHNTKKTAIVSQVGMRRRQFPYNVKPTFECGDYKLEKLYDACINTIYNQSQETIVDGMARERQQYSGDLGHVLHPLMYALGAHDLVLRFCNTFSQGLTMSGYFLDTWPAYDRLARLMEREIGMTEWGPIIDHSIGFVFDCYHYYLHTGDIDSLHEVYPRIKIFIDYLPSILNQYGTLKAEDLGIPIVWIDHLAYKKQRHKECAFSLYAAAMLKVPLPALATAMNDTATFNKAKILHKDINDATKKRFWSEDHKAYIVNKPWLKEENEIRYCDRSLATAISYDLAASNHHEHMGNILATKPNQLGMSYPTNAIWRYMALAKIKKTDVIFDELRTEWYESKSVQLNNTLGEFMQGKADSNEQWSHASISPIIMIHHLLAGIKIDENNHTKVTIAPQLFDMPKLKINHQTTKGPIALDLLKNGDSLQGTIILPKGIEGHFTFKEKLLKLKEGINYIK